MLLGAKLLLIRRKSAVLSADFNMLWPSLRDAVWQKTGKKDGALADNE